MKAIVAGGRNYIPDERAKRWIQAIFRLYNVDFELCGGASGADEFGRRVAIEMGIHGKIYQAKWKEYGKKAGPIRNERMAKEADICILFPGGAGTAYMKRRAIEHGLKIVEYQA